jgi:hypothetical protein
MSLHTCTQRLPILKKICKPARHFPYFHLCFLAILIRRTPLTMLESIKNVIVIGVRSSRSPIHLTSVLLARPTPGIRQPRRSYRVRARRPILHRHRSDARHIHLDLPPSSERIQNQLHAYLAPRRIHRPRRRRLRHRHLGPKRAKDHHRGRGAGWSETVHSSLSACDSI